MKLEMDPRLYASLHCGQKCDKCKRYFRAYELVEVHRNNVVVRTLCERCYNNGIVFTHTMKGA